MNQEIMSTLLQVSADVQAVSMLLVVLAASISYATLFNHHSLRNKIANTVKIILILLGVEYLRIRTGIESASIASTVFLALLGSMLTLGDWAAYLLCKFTELSAESSWMFLSRCAIRGGKVFEKGHKLFITISENMKTNAAAVATGTNVEARLAEIIAVQRKKTEKTEA